MKNSIGLDRSAATVKNGSRQWKKKSGKRPASTPWKSGSTMFSVTTLKWPKQTLIWFRIRTWENRHWLTPSDILIRNWKNSNKPFWTRKRKSMKESKSCFSLCARNSAVIYQAFKKIHFLSPNSTRWRLWPRLLKKIVISVLKSMAKIPLKSKMGAIPWLKRHWRKKVLCRTIACLICRVTACWLLPAPIWRVNQHTSGR